MQPEADPLVPQHIAVIMDGNGRWARKRGLPRTVGHKHGAEAARRIVRLAQDAGIKFITLFGFSSENWSRPEKEVQELMKLLRHYLRSETAEFHKNNARLRVVGDRSAFDDDIVQLIRNAEDLTKDNTGITVVIALNYGGKWDIAQAMHSYIAQNPDAGQHSIEQIEKAMSNYLVTSDIPDPDLLIRTSGEMRISNFLLWQCAYAEMVFLPVLWPDFDKKDLDAALEEYAARDRRYGNVRQSEA